MSLIPTVYRSTDPGAPVLSGTPGSLATLLDAVLVDGYGTGPDAKPGLGWARVFTGLNKRAYRNSLAEGGTGMYIRVDDPGTYYANISGYHSMIDVDAGVDGFSMGANSWCKSITENTISRDWIVVGNARTAYVFIQNGNSLNGYCYGGFIVGDYECLNKSYQFNFCIGTTGDVASTTSPPRSNLLSYGIGIGSWQYGAISGARSFDGAAIGAELVPMRPLFLPYASYHGNGAGLTYPYPATGGMVIARVMLTNDGYIFGAFPGLWSPQHDLILTKFTIYKDVAGLGSGTYLSVESQSNNAQCQGLLRIDAAWEY